MKTPVFTTLTLFALGLAPLSAQAEPSVLTDPERQALIDRLDELRDGAKSNIKTRIDAALAAYVAALSSPQATLEFYISCIESADFKRRGRDAQEFREWKRRNNERLDSDALALALQHQLRWLMLTLKAALEPEAVEMSRGASRALEGIFNDAPNLRGQAGLLGGNVLESPFSRAYRLEELKVQDWPRSPLPVAQVFEQVILPPLRSVSRLDELETAWQRRIKYEAFVVASLDRAENVDDDDEDEEEARATEAQERFQTETLPQMQWDMHSDLFASGDPRGAAMRMIDHLEGNLAHSQAREWERDFRLMVDPPEEGEERTDEDDE